LHFYEILSEFNFYVRVRTYEKRVNWNSGVLAGGGGTAPPQLAILGGRKNEKGAPIPRRILKVGGKKRI
jgi:hypothetical protein